MILYHGSERIIEKPQFGFGKTNNDYGQGFYCTEMPELAKEWACKDERGGVVNSYRLDTDDLCICDLSSRSVLEWLAVLLFNRRIRYSSPVERQSAEYLIAHFLPDLSKADVISGYRADDSYFSFARAFLSNTISLEQLGRAMKLGKLGMQIFIRSRVAFDRLCFIEAEPVRGADYYPARTKREQAAREDYEKLLEESVLEGLFIRDIIREEVTPDELRLL